MKMKLVPSEPTEEMMLKIRPVMQKYGYQNRDMADEIIATLLADCQDVEIDRVAELEAKLAEAIALLIEQYEADKALYESSDDSIATDYEPMLDRHDKSYEALGSYVEAMKGDVMKGDVK
jgi:hypothetical protein